MHQVAEYGVAAHWAYKEGKTNGVKQTKDSQKLNVVKEILEMRSESHGTDEFMQGIQSDIFTDKVYAFTPKGDVIEMPKGAGPLDMAYQIHTEVGNHTTGAKVNGRIVPLDYEIKNGDIVDILTSSSSAGPSRDWLELVSTRRARNKIRSFFRAHNREENIEQGKQMLESQLQEAGYVPSELMTEEKCQEVASHLHYKSSDDMFAAVGFGDLAPVGVRNRFTADIRKKAEDDRKEAAEKAVLEDHQTLQEPDERERQKQAKASSEGVVVEGVDNLLVRLSHCCNPVPGDEITGYITKGRGVSVHRADCPNIRAAQKSGQRIVSVYWANPEGDKTNYSADIEVQGYNRNGMLNDVLRSINNSTRYLNSVNGKVDHNKMVTISLTIGVRNLTQLQLIMDALKNIRDVYVVKRVIR